MIPAVQIEFNSGNREFMLCLFRDRYSIYLLPSMVWRAIKTPQLLSDAWEAYSTAEIPGIRLKVRHQAVEQLRKDSKVF